MIVRRRGPARVASLFVVFLLAALAGSARAEDRRVLVFPLSGSVPGDPGDALPRLTQVVARSAGLTGAEVIVGQATFDDIAALAGCATADAACLAQVARELHVDHVVLGTVEPSADGKTVKVSLTAFVNGKVTQRTITLPATSLDAMVEQLARDVPALFVGSSAAAPTEPAAKPPADPGPTGPVLVPPPASPRDDGFQSGRVSMVSWMLAGGGLVLAGTGVAMLFLASDRQAEVDAAPVGTVMDLERLQDLEDEGARYNLLGQGLLIGGGVALVAGTVLVIYQGNSGSSTPPRRVSFNPMLLRGGAGLNVQVTLP